MNHRGVSIRGLGVHVPDRVVDNDELRALAPSLDPDWLVKSGTRNRRFVSPAEDIYTLARAAASKAIDASGVAPRDIGLLLFSSGSFPRSHLSPTAVVPFAQSIGVDRAHATFLNETCCGSLVAMDLAANSIAAGQVEHALVVASDTYSLYFNVDNPILSRVCVPFGDGAAAVVLSRTHEPGVGHVASVFHSNADFQSGVGLVPRRDGTGLVLDFTGFPTYKGTVQNPEDAIEVLKKFTIESIADAIREVLHRAALQVDDIKLFALHQPLRFYLEGWKRAANLPDDRVLDTFEEFGNVLGVSPLLNLERAVRDGRLEPGDRVLIASIGAGSTWGASIWQWDSLG